MATPKQLAALKKARAAKSKKSRAVPYKKRRVPLTKSGKPDKRFAPSTKSRSKTTGKPPVKRTQKRRAKPQRKGYSANPRGGYILKVTGFKTAGYWTGSNWNTNKTLARVYSTIATAKRALPRVKAATGSQYGIAAVPVKK